jgi:predicted phage terminase large subunit-like protein
MVWMPPQHGKSELISRYFPVWYLGHHPEHRIILSSYEADFAASWGRKARDIFKEWANPIFNLDLRDDSSSVKHWDIKNHNGGMDTSGAGGSQTGKPANFFDIDDPHKNPQEARSPVFQERIYNWYGEAVDTRLPKDGIISITQTRWDVLDLSGRILENEPYYFYPEAIELINDGNVLKDEWVILRLPAIAEKNDILNRSLGEALCPPLFPIDVLKGKQSRMRPQRFGALYQGTPTPDEGEMFERAYFKIIPKNHPFMDIISSTGLGVDLAGTKKKANQTKSQGPANTAMVLASITNNKDFIIHDVKTLQDKPGAIRTAIKAKVIKDQYEYGSGIKIRIAHDPGQAAIDQMERYGKELMGFNFKPFREADIGSKEDRADNVATHGELFTIYLVEGIWNEDYIQECVDFPNGKYKDRVDATSVIYSVLFKESNRRKIRAKSLRR